MIAKTRAKRMVVLEAMVERAQAALGASYGPKGSSDAVIRTKRRFDVFSSQCSEVNANHWA